MGASGPSMQELIRRRRRAGFVGRRDELTAFRGNFEIPVDDERHRFLFHVHGNAGVGKTFLVRELEQVARERGALTAYVDEAVGSVPEALAALGSQFAAQGHRLKDLDRRLAAHRERRHEAESASAAALVPEQSEPASPSAGSMAVARAGLVGLGLVPGVGAFAGAVDPAPLARGADRLKAGLSARLGSQEDAQLVLAPEKSLTPVLLTELAHIAASVPWVVLFFDTYERTGPFLDGWLRDVMTTERYGTLPANVVVTTAGQRDFDASRWGGYADYVGNIPLEPFTEAESRGLLADKGVVAEPVVEEVLRLTGGLPVLVSTLAESRPADPDDVGDPSPTAVERFLKWEQDEVRRAVALACALPRRLDADVFRAAVGCPDEDAATLYGWLRGLAFVSDRGDRVQYHGVVRSQMLRLQRHQSPRDWADRQTRLAETFGAWRAEAEAGLSGSDAWSARSWRELRLAQSYHLLCAGPRAALPGVLREAVDAIDEGESVGRAWAQMIAEAGDDAGADTVAEWGRDLLSALEAGGTVAALGLLLDRAAQDPRTRALIRTVRGRDLRHERQFERAVVEYDRAIELDAEQARAYYGRGYTRLMQVRAEDGLVDLDRAVELAPGDTDFLIRRAEAHWVLDHLQEALADADRALELGSDGHEALAIKGLSLYDLKRGDEALDALDRAIAMEPTDSRALTYRAKIWRDRGDDTRQWEDLDRALSVSPDDTWVALQRGEHLRLARRYPEALAELDRALSIDDAYAAAHASRGVTHYAQDHDELALRDLDRAIELSPDYGWALVQRAAVRNARDETAQALADLDRAVEIQPDNAWYRRERAEILRQEGRYEEALADFDVALGLDGTDEVTHARRGVTLRSLDRTAEALTALDRALELDADYVWALVHRAKTSHRLDAPDRAMADLDRAKELGPDLAWVAVERGEVLRMTRRYVEALAEFDRAIGLDAEYAQAHACRGMTLYRLDRDDEALAALSRSLELDPDYAWAWVQRAEVHRYLRDFPRALSDADRAADLDPSSASYLEIRINVSLAVGRLDQAWADLARHLELGGDRGQNHLARAVIHLYQGHAEQTLAELGQRGAVGDETDGPALQVEVYALRLLGNLAAARRVATRLRTQDVVAGSIELALTAGVGDVHAAEALWRDAEHLAAVPELSTRVKDQSLLLLSSAALADWPALDSRLAELLASGAAWDDLTEIALALTELLNSPGADRTRLAPRLARVVAARDAVQERYAA
ncbi:tetratricopeptide repeat protein [Streptomyces sp. NBC_01361]|uniref:tetratricopeptide repeat protein n=1 Tax=Streptomyces sp. NBC_01361 TaxID=2903838 RepID=UPI002E336796|nr:tetratricopeptide repeat protein [Streptomyces sp. NBC_01361]